MAARLNWMPDCLYNSSIVAVVSNLNVLREDVLLLPNDLLFDVLYKLFQQNDLTSLEIKLTNLETFLRLLQCKDKRILLHHCFQGLLDNGVPIANKLSSAFAQKICLSQHKCQSTQEKSVIHGFTLGSFFVEAGWFEAAETTFSACLQLAKLHVDSLTSHSSSHSLKYIAIAAECCIRLMHVQNLNCRYAAALVTYGKAKGYFDWLDKLVITFKTPSSFSIFSSSVEKSLTPLISRAALHGEWCALLFARSQYDAAYIAAEAALKELKSTSPPYLVVDILRQSSKACVVKREFQKAEVLIKGAVCLAWEHFGKEHPKFADALLDYGFYLLNVDCIAQSEVVYQLALNVRNHCFKGCNINVALAHEDLAYSTYVLEYSTGNFEKARHHAERATEIITHIVPKDHLLLASSKRVKALILEEIAIDSGNKEEQQKLLAESEELHLHSLSLALLAFGENNVQTAKHYGNLGRLYQSMHKYQQAEEMHVRAIEIKERILGVEDYEVALSVGHLASLYNYDMEMYDKAEKLYLRSITIGKKLFGDAYSGLEYDYRGLIRLYYSTANVAKALEYQAKLHDWSNLRDEMSNDVASEVYSAKSLTEKLMSDATLMAGSPLVDSTDLDILKQHFFSLPCKFIIKDTMEDFLLKPPNNSNYYQETGQL